MLKDMKKSLMALFAFATCSFASCGEGKTTPLQEPDDTAIDWSAAADVGSRALINSFWDESERYFWTNSYGDKTFQYWPQAHALDVLVDAYERSGSDFYRSYFDLWFDGVRRRNGYRWYNSYFDDMEWIALAMLRVHKATGEAKYKDATLELWRYIKEGWNDYASGGIAWERDNNIWSKNACSNGPACILAARLYREFGDEADREWALKIYEWEKTTLFNPDNGAAYDNINGKTGAKNTNKSWIFTYNQGTFIGAAVELHKITGSEAYLSDAKLAARYAMNSLVEVGNDALTVLKNEGSGDGGLFKGIFVRYFTELIRQERLDDTSKALYADFLQRNAEALWTKGANQEFGLFGASWTTKPAGAKTGLTEQISGCMLLEAMSVLHAEL
jgi:predicted alpha-1,6-mannanase (GH76 family)